jgi:hypothetical protein
MIHQKVENNACALIYARRLFVNDINSLRVAEGAVPETLSSTILRTTPNKPLDNHLV